MLGPDPLQKGNRKPDSGYLEGGAVDGAVDGNVGMAPCPATPHSCVPSDGWSSIAPSGHHSFQGQHLTWKLGSETPRGAQLGSPKERHLVGEEKEA